MDESLDLTSMEFPVDPTTLPTRSELPIGQVHLEIKNFTMVKSGQPSDEDAAKGKVGGKVGVAIQFALMDPSELAGIPHTERVWIGTDQDPEAKKPATWARNAVPLMKLFKEAGVSVQPTSKFPELCSAATGQKVGADVNKRASTRINPKTGAPYEAQIRLSYWKVGTKQVHLIETGEEVGSNGFASAPQTSANLSSSD